MPGELSGVAGALLVAGPAAALSKPAAAGGRLDADAELRPDVADDPGSARAYPQTTKLFSIGHTWQERELWCLEVSAPIAAAPLKTGLAMFGNIHGGEQQSGMSAAYTAWWLATQYGKDPAATAVLRKFNVYVVPLINPDGYQRSFTVSVRQNMRPTDKNGIAGPFSDPRVDTNGRLHAQIYQQTSGPAGRGTIVSAPARGRGELNGVTQ